MKNASTTRATPAWPPGPTHEDTHEDRPDTTEENSMTRNPILPRNDLRDGQPILRGDEARDHRRPRRASLAPLAWLPIFPLLAAGACAGPASPARDSWHNVALATGPTASDVPATQSPPAGPTAGEARVPGSAAGEARVPGSAAGEARFAGATGREGEGGAAIGATAQVAPAVAGGAREAPLAPIRVERISDETLRDPARRALLMQRIARQIATRARGLSAARYTQQLRPRLQQQLRTAGFAPDDVDFILTDVDGARVGQ